MSLLNHKRIDRATSGRFSRFRAIGSVIAAAVLCFPLLSPTGSEARVVKAFPDEFLWGTAIAAFQNEMGQGAPNDTNSDFWAWVHDNDNITNGLVSGDLPEDGGPGFFDNFTRDIKRARRLGRTNAFRLSIEWSRVFPSSTAGVDISNGFTPAVLAELDALADQNAVVRYREILASVRKRKLEPIVTLWHNTLPLWVHEPFGVRDAFTSVDPFVDPVPTGMTQAGWLDATTPDEFAKYAAYAGFKFGDLVDTWATINEPVVLGAQGYLNIAGVGDFRPPGIASFAAVPLLTDNLVTGHARAYDALHSTDAVDASADGTAATVGLVKNMLAVAPANPLSTLDVDSASHLDYVFNKVVPTAITSGGFDANVDGDTTDPGETRPDLAGRCDYLGVNYYQRVTVQGLGSAISPFIPLFDFVPTFNYATPENPSAPPCPTKCNDFGWEIYPAGLREVLGFAGALGVPIIITENGTSDALDEVRAQYIFDHINVLHGVIADGVADVRGYLYWTLVDNYEWTSGFSPKAGLYWLDRDTGRRRLRKGSRPFKKIVRRNGLTNRLIDQYGSPSGAFVDDDSGPGLW